ncbi:DNA/RNA helicase domain-containing protein [Eisenbergiella tayi]|uniref:DNA/RNA helicase domain-containing protein n=1 Tax=Eisenbergiella tayi TaxID=1432052 RepID=UPI0009BD4643|nr:DNA/RNA helicase domain-containing protein [Eisenbergiella tayi]
MSIKKGNDLDTFASQFNCQGLELDYTIVIWGRKMLRRGDKWEISKDAVGTLDSYCKKIDDLKNQYPELDSVLNVDKDQIRDTFIKNCYRVLLTRSRISTYIYVEDQETYLYLKSIIEACKTD